MPPTLRCTSLALSLLVACAHHHPAPPPPASAAAGHDVLAELAGLRDRMCACTTEACARQVTEEVGRFADRYADVTADADQQARAEVIAAELATCVTRIVAPATTP